MDENAMTYIRLAESLLYGEGSAKRDEWQAIADLVAPELLDASVHNENSPGTRERACPEAAECADKLTGAHMSYLTPMGHYWFRFSAWGLEQEADLSDEEREEIELWYAKITDVVKEALERSNFYDEALTTFFDRVVTGTGAMFCEEDHDTRLPWFSHVPMGTFGTTNDVKRRPNTFVRTLRMTAQQIAEAFPRYDNYSESVSAALEHETDRFTREFEVWHIVRPRPGYNRKNYEEYDPSTYPFESVYIDKTGQSILKIDGYKEFPVLVTRYTTAGAQIYGTSPFVKARDIIEDLRLMSDIAVESAKKKVMPPVLVAPEMVGQVDISSGGMTVVPHQYTGSGLPREWALSGDVRELLEHIERLKGALRAITQVDYLEIISSVDREMTAREVVARQGERVMAYARTFTQFKSDFAPFLIHILNCCIRLNLINLDDAPDILVKVDENGRRVLKDPKVLYVGRMAQSMEQAQLQSVDEVVNRLYELASLTHNATLAMVVHEERVARGQAIAAGMPRKYLRSIDEMNRMKAEVKAARDQQQLAQDELTQAQANEHAANAALTLRELQQL